MNQYTICLLFDRTDRNRLLMCLKDRTSYKGLFNGIGGKLEPGETPIDAALREIQEETGAKPVGGLVHLGSTNSADCTGKPDATDSCALHFFAGFIDPALVSQQPDETELLAWIPYQTLQGHPEFFANDEGLLQRMGRIAWYKLNGPGTI